MVFTFKRYFISIDPTYIMISVEPFENLPDYDYDTNKLTGYDRCDGVNYYKNFPDKKVVDFISTMIINHKLTATDFKGNLITSTDE